MLCLAPDAWNKWIEFFLTAIFEQAKANADKARQIIDLYEQLKSQVIEVTHSQFAVPVLDHMFRLPIFPSNSLDYFPNKPTKATILALLNKLKSIRILTVLRESSGRRPQLLAFRELINLCEGEEVM